MWPLFPAASAIRKVPLAAGGAEPRPTRGHCAPGPSSDPCPALVSVAGPERHRAPGARLAESGSPVSTEAWPARHGGGALPCCRGPASPSLGLRLLKTLAFAPAGPSGGLARGTGRGPPRPPVCWPLIVEVPEHSQGRPPWTPPVKREAPGGGGAVLLCAQLWLH